MQHRPKFCFVIKCTMPIGRTLFLEIGRLCESDSSFCSPPLGTYEKVQKTKKNSFALIYKIPKLQVKICNTNKVMYGHLSMCRKTSIFGPFLVFSIYRGGETPQTPSNIKSLVPIGVRNNSHKFQKRPGNGPQLSPCQRLLISFFSIIFLK